ncbi:hypothetical protein WDZ16_16585 [Pseudokineococcus marinus]|uniref:Uncharacterized protein n=1 Tax=Pseudokineococcus marinus TaxID=351215 RepID=A0A849BPN7_9ACTN|nr:hypothetical protein [Pseudokineococcus marinus]NNH22524.1 hypothetical protein [Pseudokineococcus marinus]
MEPVDGTCSPRPLTLREEAVLVAMIERGVTMGDDTSVTDADRSRWLAQVPRTRAGRPCGCGTCPSIGLTDTDGSTPELHDDRVVLQASTTGALLLLFIDGDRLSELELAPLSDGTPFSQFPDPDGLSFFD